MYDREALFEDTAGQKWSEHWEDGNLKFRSKLES